MAIKYAGYIYLAQRVKDLPAPYVNSVRRKCSKCDEDVWVSEMMEYLSIRMTIMCIKCLEEST